MPLVPLDAASRAYATSVLAAMPASALSITGASTDSPVFSQVLQAKQAKIGQSLSSTLDSMSPAARRAFDAAISVTPTAHLLDVATLALNPDSANVAAGYQRQHVVDAARINAQIDSLLSTSADVIAPQDVLSALRDFQRIFNAQLAKTNSSASPTPASADATA